MWHSRSARTDTLKSTIPLAACALNKKTATISSLSVVTPANRASKHLPPLSHALAYDLAQEKRVVAGQANCLIAKTIQNEDYSSSVQNASLNLSNGYEFHGANS